MNRRSPVRAGASRSGAQRPFRLRLLLRTLHRDAGYLAAGLTVVYATSGIAVNHLADWDPNFQQVQEEHTVALPLPEAPELAAKQVLAALKIGEPTTDVYAAAPDRLEVSVGERTLIVDPTSGHVLIQGQSPRFFFRAVNWLHLNRGKKAWTYVADGYAAFLLFLVVSGLFMLPGRKGLVGRGGVLALVGALVPVAYVVFSAP